MNDITVKLNDSFYTREIEESIGRINDMNLLGNKKFKCLNAFCESDFKTNSRIKMF